MNLLSKMAINMQIKNKTFLIIANNLEVFSVEEIEKNLERPRAALEMMLKGKCLPETFLKIALTDLEQASFLLDGSKNMTKN